MEDDVVLEKLDDEMFVQEEHDVPPHELELAVVVVVAVVEEETVLLN